MLSSKQKGHQTYSGNIFLSLELALGVKKFIKKQITCFTILNNLSLAKDALKYSEGVQTYSADIFLSLKLAVGSDHKIYKK